MSMWGPKAGGKRADQVGETVASFPTYEGAQKAVSQLIAGEVPARQIAIVGLGLRSIERITGRLGYAAAARSGAINGLLIGLLFSLIFVVGAPTVSLQAFVGVLFVGIAIGMLMSLMTYSFVRRRRDYASVMQVVADHYEVTVEAEGLAKARQVLGRASESPAAPAAPAPGAAAPPAPPLPPATPPADPPRYGERTTEPPRYGERIEQPRRSDDDGDAGASGTGGDENR
ncbi:general stress protein [Microbacterium limosum]|uniref:General stress protein n=1 Tax=Microbacterium limosum TaxID=3079935 RepID=A0AAU0MJ78_9MICO|nr:general stress protein [Microbacterium sp. Y20]WOQ70306.1 general stress protein [Microbacterium sp. Y20]